MRFNNWFSFYLNYQQKPRWDTGISPPELITYLDTHPTGRALDLGCGTGTNLVKMAQKGWIVVGVDFIPTAVHAARNKLSYMGLSGKVILGSVTRLYKFSEPFNLVLDIGCFHNLTVNQKKIYIVNLSRYLKPGGNFLLYAHYKQNENDWHGIDDGDLSILANNLIQLEISKSYETWKDKPDLKNPSVWGLFQKR